MDPELAKLVQLQELEQQAHALEAQLAEYPRLVASRRASLLETSRRLEENAISQAQQTALRRRMESGIEDLRQKSARYRTQLDQVQSDSQRIALEHQITFCDQEIEAIQENEFSSLVETEALEAEERVLQETADNQTQALEDETAAAELGHSRDTVALEKLREECQTVRQTIDASMLAQYDRITGARRFAIAVVEQQRCSACQMILRPQRWNEIRQGTVQLCESCGRFLYYNPAIDLSDAIELPPRGKKSSGAARSSGRAQATGSDPAMRED